MFVKTRLCWSAKQKIENPVKRGKMYYLSLAYLHPAELPEQAYLREPLPHKHDGDNYPEDSVPLPTPGSGVQGFHDRGDGEAGGPQHLRGVEQS